MAGSMCKACNEKFADKVEEKLHYKSAWHRYNLKRKVAGVPRVTEKQFKAGQSALAKEKGKEKRKLDDTHMVYSCVLCSKDYSNLNAHAQHLKSKGHLTRASKATTDKDETVTVTKPLPRRVPKKPSRCMVQEGEESEQEEVDPEEELSSEASHTLRQIKANKNSFNNDVDENEDCEDDAEDLDPSRCFMCDLRHDTVESCMVHVHKQHGLFIPDVEYLKDPIGLLTYLGLKVERDFTCLYCNEGCRPFNSLEAVRKHMEAKSHCKVHYGDAADQDEEGELEDFYDYSSSYVDADGKQLVAVDDVQNSVKLGSGFELIITRRINGATLTKMLGFREYLRYYRQKPRPSPESSAITAALASMSKRIDLATVQLRKGELKVLMKAIKGMNRCSIEAMRSKISTKNNAIRKLSKNIRF